MSTSNITELSLNIKPRLEEPAHPKIELTTQIGLSLSIPSGTGSVSIWTNGATATIQDRRYRTTVTTRRLPHTIRGQFRLEMDISTDCPNDPTATLEAKTAAQNRHRQVLNDQGHRIKREISSRYRELKTLFSEVESSAELSHAFAIALSSAEIHAKIKAIVLDGEGSVNDIRDLVRDYNKRQQTDLAAVARTASERDLVSGSSSGDGPSSPKSVSSDGTMVPSTESPPPPLTGGSLAD